jgi:hypothetical protein
MSGVEDMIRCAERSLGLTGRPNAITRWYAGRNGAYFLRAAWCNQSITYWAHQSGNASAVCFGRDYAYTVWHAQRFRQAGDWHVDIAGIRRGDIVFFDWGGSNRIGAIDHVGLVTGVRGAVVFTIEGNTSDGCRRRARYATNIVGYGRPVYAATGARPALAAARSKAPADAAPPGRPVLRRGSAGLPVRQLQLCLNAVQKSRLTADGDFGPRTQAAVQAFQRGARLLADGEYGMRTAGALTVARRRIRV